MRNKKTRTALEIKLNALQQELTSVSARREATLQKINEAGFKWVKTKLSGWPRGRMKISLANEILHQQLSDLDRLYNRIHYEIEQFTSLLKPPAGRPKKIDIAIDAAVSEWRNATGTKPRPRQLAFRHCPEKTEKARRRFIFRLRKKLQPYRKTYTARNN
jgi:hypothetical protein